MSLLTKIEVKMILHYGTEEDAINAFKKQLKEINWTLSSISSEGDSFRANFKVE